MKKMMLCALICLFCVPVYANSFAADMLVKSGRAAYVNGDVRTAIDNFNKALLLQPDHREALGYLKTIRSLPQKTALSFVEPAVSFQADMAAPRKVIHVIHLPDMGSLSESHQVQSLQNQVSDLTREIQTLQNQPPEHVFSSPKVPEKVYVVPVIVKKSDENPLVDKAKVHQDTIKLLDTSLAREDELLLLSRETRELKKDVQNKQAQDQNVLEVMEDYVYGQQAQMEDLGNQLAISSLQQIRKNQDLLQKTQSLMESQYALENVAQKLDQRDSIIQQKNLQINDLQKRLEWYQKSFDVPSS